MLQIESQLSVARHERLVGGETLQRVHESLFYVLRCHSVELFEKLRTLVHQVSDHYQGVGWILSHECAELRRCDEKCFCLLGRVRIGDIDTIGSQAFDAERLPACDHSGDESTTRSNPVSKND